MANGAVMSIKAHNDSKVGDILYLTELKGDAPVSMYVIRGDKGDMLVDTGFGSTYRPICKWISANGFNITDIMITHAHPDHDWNAARLKELFGARIWLGREDVPLIRNFSSQPQVATDKRFEMRVKWITFWTGTPFFKSKPYEPDIIIDENIDDTARKYGYDVKFIPLPGHTYGSYGIFEDGVLYAGDAYAVIDGVPMLPPHAASVELMNRSYSKITELAPRYLACGHGLPFEFECT